MIYFDGWLLPDSITKLVTDITLDQAIDGFDQCTLKFNDPDYSLLGDNYFIKDTQVEVRMYIYPSDSSEARYFKFFGCISAIDLSFPESGVPSISITCIDYYSHWLNRFTRSFTLSGSSFSKGYVTNADVINHICNQRWKGLNPPKIQGGYYYRREDSISESKSTDITFMQGLAKKEVYPFYCKFITESNGKTYLYYKKKGILSTPITDLYYKSGDCTIRSFSPQINKETVKANITEANVNLKNKLIITGVANNQVTYQETIGKGVQTLGSLSASSSIVYRESDDSTQDATKLFVDIQYNTLKGDISVIPTSKVVDINIDKTINLFGLGTNLSGAYYVTGVKRAINSSGYSQTISVMKNGFRDTLFNENSNKDSRYWTCGYFVNDLVKIKEGNAYFANELEGVSLTYDEKRWTYRITDISFDGTRVQIVPVNSDAPKEKKWIYIQYITR